MRRFRGKGVLVMVAAMLLLGDLLWTRGVPRLEVDPPETPSTTAVLYAVAETETAGPRATMTTTALPTAAAVSATVPFDIPVSTVRPAVTILPLATHSSAAPSASLTTPPASLPPAPQEPRLALEETLRPVVTARVAALGEPASTVRLNNVLPPRPWAPPQGIAYIRWWMA